MRNKVVLIHGWSATSSSMLDLKAYLRGNGFTVADVWLGDYVSMDDDVRIEDVAKRMQRVLRGDGDRLGRRYDMIVHSTGGLVAREWLSQFYPDGVGTADDPCPVRRLLMLAPANFGSKLASSGKSLIGRVAKGWDNWFHTGAEMLTELELASSYVWNLARRDLIAPEGGQSPYGTGRVLPFVIAGTCGYRQGLQQVVNEHGSDGTVRPCAADLNARGYTIDFRVAAEAPAVTLWTPKRGAERTAFAVLPDRDHGTILSPAADSGWTSSGRLGEMIMAALDCEDAGYAALCDAWDAISEETAHLGKTPAELAAAFPSGAPDPQELHQYMQVIVLVRDDDGVQVGDYFLEFFCPQVPGEQDSVIFHRDVLDDVHTNGVEPSRRCFFVDRSDLVDGFYSDGRTQVAMSISAAPIGANVRYFDSTAEGAKGELVVHAMDEIAREDLPGRLRRNRTHLVEIVIPRRPTDGVFRLTN